MKSGYAQNVVPTSTVQNIVAAAQEKTLHRAQGKFRALEHANNRGTGEHQFDILETHFINEKGVANYIKEGL